MRQRFPPALAVRTYRLLVVSPAPRGLILTLATAAKLQAAMDLIKLAVEAILISSPHVVTPSFVLTEGFRTHQMSLKVQAHHFQAGLRGSRI